MEMIPLFPGHPLWSAAAGFALHRSWRAGAALAEKMTTNAFLPWERVFIAADRGRFAGFCTLAAQDELPAEHGLSPFIGFVFVDEAYRGRRLSGQLISAALRYAEALGYQAVYLMSGEKGLYEKYGFENMGEYKTIYGTVDQLFRYVLSE